MKAYMNDVSVEDAIKAGRTDTLCWDCKKAMVGGCSWSDPERQKAVDGWEAVKHGESYVVHACPEFVRETYGCGRYRTVDDYILALEIAVQERRVQLARVKKTPELLRQKNKSLTKANKEMRHQLTRLQWQISVHEGE